MDPNLDLDVVSLDKGIADLEATGTSTWDFQTQDCDPLSLAERLKALKERDTTPLLTSGPSKSTPQSQGACKAARYCYVPNVSTWGNLQPNTLYTRPDGLWGRLKFTKFADIDIIFNPYITMLCMVARSATSITSQTINHSVSITREGGEDANLEKNIGICIQDENSTSVFASNSVFALGIYYKGQGTKCTVNMIYNDGYLATQRAPVLLKGKSLFARTNFCSAPMYYGFSKNRGTVNRRTGYGSNIIKNETYTHYANPSSSTEPPCCFRDLSKYTESVYSETGYRADLTYNPQSLVVVGYIVPYFSKSVNWKTDLVENVDIGSRFSGNVYNIPEEWQVL